jgi:hypothetical protein
VSSILNFPPVVFACSFVALWLAEWVGARGHKKRPELEKNRRDDFNLIAAASLTLMGLIIGFSFSMAISRYDQRKNYEEAEANAIGTEYVRADLLPGTDCGRVRALLRNYLNQRILFYETRNEGELQQINAATAELQNDLWTAVQSPAVARPTPLTALAVSGMNDVLNSEGRTQASWWNRIPGEAWGLLAIIALCSNMLIGYGVSGTGTKGPLFLVLPFLVSISLLLISDIDSPRGGLVRVRPQNLESLWHSLHAHEGEVTKPGVSPKG